MTHRKAAVRGLLLIATAMLGAAACGGGSDDGEADATPAATRPAPPSPAETTEPPETDPGAEPGIRGARAALQAFLRGQAAGDTSVCRYVAKDSDFLNGPALRGDCRKGVKDTPHLLRPRERLALRRVLATGGKITKRDEAVLPFSGLRWTDGHLTESALQPEFVLRRDGEGMWQIVR
ncbi:hypothetical protein [Actinomadura geliboluensis]|uniref:hypothetical protein n=1 Tax=Actinomadura geliboluensis TaxID=882440 RepID=UPI00371D7474